MTATRYNVPPSSTLVITVLVPRTSPSRNPCTALSSRQLSGHTAYTQRRPATSEKTVSLGIRANTLFAYPFEFSDGPAGYIQGADDFGRQGKKRRKDRAMTHEGMRDMQGNLQGGAQRWVDTMQRLAEQIQKQQQVSQEMTQELMNTYVQLLNTQGSYLSELPQQQQNFQQLAQQAMEQAQEQQRTLQQQARGQQQNFQQVFQQTFDTFSQLFNIPASHAGESARIAQESAQIVQRRVEEAEARAKEAHGRAEEAQSGRSEAQSRGGDDEEGDTKADAAVRQPLSKRVRTSSSA